MTDVFFKIAIEAIERGEARRIDGVVDINDNEYDYKVYLIPGVRPIIRIDILKRETTEKED